jgi:hypothetical protein
MSDTKTYLLTRFNIGGFQGFDHFSGMLTTPKDPSKNSRKIATLGLEPSSFPYAATAQQIELSNLVRRQNSID